MKMMENLYNSLQHPVTSSCPMLHSMGKRALSGLNLGEGTWYISALCKIFKENYKTMDVVSMITDVHKEVNEKA